VNSDKLLERLSLIIFALLGVGLLLVADVLSEDTLLSNALLSLGVVFLSVTAVTWTWRLGGGDPATRGLKKLQLELNKQVTVLRSLFDILGDSNRSGLQRFFERRAAIPPDLEWDLLKAARQHVDLCGRSLFGWINDDDERFASCVRENVLHGCRYRILLYKPYLKSDPADDSPFLNDGDLEQVRSDEVTNSHTKKALRYYLDLQASLDQQYSDHFTVKVLTKTIYVLVSRFDDTMMVAPYIAHTLSPQSPQMLVRQQVADDEKGSSFFSLMEAEFEALWKVAQFPSDDLLGLLRADVSIRRKRRGISTFEQ
jgi:hypothetical protein